MNEQMKWLTTALLSSFLVIGCGQPIEENSSDALTEESSTSSADLTASCPSGWTKVAECASSSWGYVKCQKFDVFKNYKELKCTGLTHCVDLGTSITCKYN